MKRICLLSVMVCSVWLAGGSAAEAEYSGTWNVSFFEGPESFATETFQFQQFLILVTANSDPPESCSLIGIGLSFGGSDPFLLATVTCSQLGPFDNFFGLLFGTQTSSQFFGGLMIAPDLSFPLGSYRGVRPTS